MAPVKQYQYHSRHNHKHDHRQNHQHSHRYNYGNNHHQIHTSHDNYRVRPPVGGTAVHVDPPLALDWRHQYHETR